MCVLGRHHRVLEASASGLEDLALMMTVSKQVAQDPVCRRCLRHLTVLSTAAAGTRLCLWLPGQGEAREKHGKTEKKGRGSPIYQY